MPEVLCTLISFLERLVVAKQIASERLDTGSKTYFFDVNETDSGERYLSITETRQAPGGRYIRNSVTVFHNHADNFMATLAKAVARLKP